MVWKDKGKLYGLLQEVFRHSVFDRNNKREHERRARELEKQ